MQPGVYCSHVSGELCLETWARSGLLVTVLPQQNGNQEGRAVCSLVMWLVLCYLRESAWEESFFH